MNINLFKSSIILPFLLTGLIIYGRFQFLSAQTYTTVFDTSYSASKKLASTTKSYIHVDGISEDSLSFIFTNLLTEQIIPHWLGTP